ncbi:MAG: imidazoleglycerol-phosphate dehydratase HisB [Candidatus Woesearchaeota archaeon]|jgi:imidazoleglycerol-phosphate dehydratase
MRNSKITRNTKETQISLKLNIDGKGKYVISTPMNFLNHMLENFSKHGAFDLILNAKGDIHIDQHHTVEDIGIVIGQAFKNALGDKKGINRAGFFAFPMDDSLGIVAIDIGGRPAINFKAKFRRRYCGDFDSDILEEFFSGLSKGLSANISIYVPYGRDDHHKIESIFKAFGKALKMACSKDKRLKDYIPSTKGNIDL